MATMTLTGTFTMDELMSLSNEMALRKLREIRKRGLENDFVDWADSEGDWDNIHDVLNAYTVDEILGIEEDEEDESEVEQWNY